MPHILWLNSYLGGSFESVLTLREHYRQLRKSEPKRHKLCHCKAFHVLFLEHVGLNFSKEAAPVEFSSRQDSAVTRFSSAFSTLVFLAPGHRTKIWNNTNTCKTGSFISVHN